VRKVLVGIGAVVFALVAIVLAGGAMMPREHVATSTLVVPAPPDSVWSVIRNFEGLPDWWEGLDSVRRADVSGAEEAWRHYMTQGHIDLAVERTDAPMILVTRIVAEPGAPFGGTWTYHLQPVDGGTQITITEAGYIDSKVFRFVAGIMGVHGTIDAYLTGLARRFGADAQPQHTG
jgi:uncharacterized protein YndB with AHSA1/START domain